MDNARERRRQSGVTMLELLVTVSILLILTSIALPGMQAMLAENRRAGAVNQLIGAMMMARSEAIRRGVNVSLCKTGDVSMDPIECDVTASWHQGWVMFVDHDHVVGNLSGRIDEGDIPLRVFQSGDGVTISAGGNYALGLQFGPDGRPRGLRAENSTALGNGTFVVLAEGVRICVTVNLAGRASVREQGQRSCAG